MVNKTEKKCGIYKRHFLYAQIKVCRFEIIDGVKYVYCIKHAYKFLLREQVGFAAVLWRLRQCVSCLWYNVKTISKMLHNYLTSGGWKVHIIILIKLITMCLLKPLYYVWTTVVFISLCLFFTYMYELTYTIRKFSSPSFALT